MTYGTRRFRAAIAFTVLGVLGWVGGCSDQPGGPVTITQMADSLIVSDPILAAGVASGTGAASARESSAEDGVAYVSLPPGAVPTGSRVSIRRVGDPAFVTTAVLDGGFDPVAVAATAGDVIEVRVTDAGGATVLQQIVAVRAARPPVVVRTQPPRRKTDVPLNSAIIVYFSEPVDNATVTPTTVRLERGTTTVSGTVRFLDPTHLSVEFVPNAPLAPGTEYQLLVTGQVRDLSGEALATPVTVPFTTGASAVGEPASIRLSPDSVLNLVIGLTYDITATVRDAAGNVLIGVPLSWTSSDPAVATVVPADSAVLTFGRVRAVSPGNVTISAANGALSGSATLTVISPPANGVASVTITPDSLMLPARDGRQLTVSLRDSSGRILDNGDVAIPGIRLEVTFASSEPTVVPAPGPLRTDYCDGVYPGGWCIDWNRVWLQPLAEGSTLLIATSEGVSDTAVITVGPPRAVASVTVAPGAAALLLQTPDTQRVLRARLRDANGTEITPSNGGVRPVSWTSDNPAVATIDTVATIDRVGRGDHYLASARAVGIGSTVVTATSEGVNGASAITVASLTFASVSAGDPDGTDYGTNYPAGHTCGVTVAGHTFCWGGVRGEDGYDWPLFSPLPVLLGGGLTFAALSAAASGTCGLTATGDAYCWGNEIVTRDSAGNPTWPYPTNPPDPIDPPPPVPGGLGLASLDAGGHNLCGITSTGAAYCWGENDHGQLGDGSTTRSPSAPVAVSGGLSFMAISVGQFHACGLTPSGSAYCWGNNSSGQLGDGSTTGSSVPVAVSGGLTLAAVSAGLSHTCGLTATGAAYCWGSNASGELGDGSTTPRVAPATVSGGTSFIALSAGAGAGAPSGTATTCGLTAGGAAYCWGANQHGQIGDGSTINRSVPTAVLGGLQFASVSTGGPHTCGVTTTAVAYCWGWNGAGQLGNGTLSDSYVPTRVAGQP